MKWDYLFKHWLGALALGPVISEAIAFYLNSIDGSNIGGLLEIYPMAFFFSLFFSTPTYFLYGVLYYYLARTKIKTTCAKLILILVAVTGVIMTTLIIKGSMMDHIAWSYSIASILSGCFFKLDFKNSETES